MATQATVSTEPGTRAAAVPPRRRRRHRDLWVALGFVAPALLAAAVLRVWPMVRAVTDSLHSTPLGFGPTEWVGLEQYRALLSDPAFLNSLVVTAVFGVVINPLQVLLALALALLLNARLPATGLMRTLIFLPVAVPQSVSAVIWAIAYRPDGPLNGTLALFGLDGLRYLTSPGQALPSLMVIVSWIGVGYWMMFLIAGLKEIDPTLYEAAQIDGAGRWRQLVSITIPQLRRQLIFVLVADTISNLLVFAPVQILTNGGPNGRTDLIMNNIFERAYVAADTGSAAAATVILVVVALAIVVVQFRLLGTGEED